MKQGDLFGGELQAPKQKKKRQKIEIPANTIPYRPSNGTEGEYFMRDFCDKCKKQKGCEIIKRTWRHQVEHKNYPKEFVMNSEGEPNPRCLAFRRR